MDTNSSPKLIAIREEMKKHSIDAYLVSRNDPHMCERIPPSEERLRYISSFTGTNGFAVITLDKALLWTDGRYYIQAPQELEKGWEMMKLEINLPKWDEWCAQNLKENAVIGYNPALIPGKRIETASKVVGQNKIELRALATDLLEAIWTDQPSRPKTPIFIHDLKYCGLEAEKKLKVVGKFIISQNAQTYIVTQLEEIAWILNLRGGDNDLTPYFISYLILSFGQGGQLSSGTLFVDKEKVDDKVFDHLSNLKITIKPYEDFGTAAKAIEGSIYMDLNKSNASLYFMRPDQKDIVVPDTNIIETLKSMKNQTEIQGFQQSHIRDAVAIVRYFAWLDDQLNNHNNTEIDELIAANKLTDLRKEQADFISKSFLVTSAIGANGAIIHYKPKEGKAAKMNTKEMYLCDSGAQYIDGTTDTTRTTHFGKPTQEEIDCYTRVLLGNQDVEKLKFPQKSQISGADIDALARRHLWDAGLDYAHGTGHGVGHCLNVHEGPQGISKVREYPLHEGMATSNEPGYYKEGAFGIRIENILIVQKDAIQGFYSFLNVTVVPYERKLINLDMLTDAEIDFIDAYHQRVYNTLAPLIQEQKDDIALAYLKDKCRKLRE